jgi:16S rRNA processing protein RimM
LSADILLAAVMGAQGLKGEVKAKIFTATPDALPRYGKLHGKDGRIFTITAFRPTKPGEAVMAFEVRDRNSAENLKGTELFVDRAALPAPDEDEFYYTDLVGLEARDSEGRVLGKVAAVHNFGASDVIELTRASLDGRVRDSVHLAFTRETVPHIYIADGYIIVAVPEDDEAGDHVE